MAQGPLGAVRTATLRVLRLTWGPGPTMQPYRPDAQEKWTRSPFLIAPPPQATPELAAAANVCRMDSVSGSLQIAPDSDAMCRSAGRQGVLKPQEIAVALKLVALGPERPARAALANSLHRSPLEAQAAVQRLLAAKLAGGIEDRTWLNHPALRGFLVHGAPCAYPVIRSEIVIGSPTAPAGAPLQNRCVASDDLPPVWPAPPPGQRGNCGCRSTRDCLPPQLQIPRSRHCSPFFKGLRVGQVQEHERTATFLDERLQ